MYRFLLLVSLAIVSCGPSGATPSKTTQERFRVVYEQNLRGTALTIVQDRQTAACFVIMTGSDKGGLTTAPAEVCQ